MRLVLWVFFFYCIGGYFFFFLFDIMFFIGSNGNYVYNVEILVVV